MAYPSNQALINAINYANMKNGEVIIKLNGETITANLTSIQINMKEAHLTTLELSAVITQ
jgi:hypothetical protein